MRLHRLQMVARVLMIAAAAAAAAVSLITAVAVGQYMLATSVLAALLVRLQGPTERWRHGGAVGLVLAVAGVAGASGGPASAMMLTLLLVIGDYSLTRTPRSVVAVGFAAALLAAATALATEGIGAFSLTWIWAMALPPLVGLTVTQLGSQSLVGTAALESATSALDEVLRLAERMPAGFDRWSVAMAVHQELREASRRTGGSGADTHLLLVVQDVLFGVGDPIARQPVGLRGDLPRQRRSRVWTTVDVEDLPPGLAKHLGDGRWHLHRLGGDGTHGVVLVPHGVGASTLDEVGDVLRPASVALSNVYRFERLEDLALNAARIRVAHDLHDGVAQALTHVRFELDLLSLSNSEISRDVERIREVADSALLEVRRTVDELRERVPLKERLEGHVSLLRTFVPADIHLEVDADLDLDDETADEFFRIAQEALSNAVRHAQADTISVSLMADDHSVSLTVVDDGLGLSPSARRGVGLGGMDQRAQRLGGELLLRPRNGGGTVVQLEAPITPHAPIPSMPSPDDHTARSAP